MVAGQEMPLNVRKRPHTLKRFEQRFPSRGFRIVDIAGDDNVRCALLFTQTANGFDRLESRLAQNAFSVAELPEWLSDLPVCGVYETHRPFLPI